MEKKGVILPVYSINVQYLRPAYYDDLLTLRTEVAELKGVKITFDYKLFNNNSILLATGNVTLVF